MNCVLTARQMGLAHVFLAEGRTKYQRVLGQGTKRSHLIAWRTPPIVKYYVTTALCGAFMGNAQWNFGYVRIKPAAIRFCADDALFWKTGCRSIFGRKSLPWGAIFANAKFTTKEVITLPRASEIDCALEGGGSARSHRSHDQGRRDLELDGPLKNSTPAVLAGGFGLGV